MTPIPTELREVVEGGPLTHLTTLNADGSPQVSVVWLGIDGDELFTAHMGRYRKVRNVERDPRVVLSFLAPATGAFLEPHAVLTAHARAVQDDQAWHVLDRLTKTYLGPEETFPAPNHPGGWVIRYTVDRIGGVGPWVPDPA